MALSKTEETIYELLKSNELYRDKKGVYTVFPREYMILKSGKSEKTVKRVLTNLEEQSYIHREWIAEEHIMLYYFPKEDFVSRHIHDRYENCTVYSDRVRKLHPLHS